MSESLSSRDEALLDTGRTVTVATPGPDLRLAERGEPGTTLPALPLESIGSRAFLDTFGLRHACTAGAMANGIASVDLVVAMAEAGGLASFGAAGLPLEQIRDAVQTLQSRLGLRAFACNLIHSPDDPAVELETARFYAQSGVPVVEASAFLQLTPAVVLCRARGLRRGASGRVEPARRLIAKVSRREVAEPFLRPAPEELLRRLAAEGELSSEEVALASEIPLCDALTVEADSGGHTDGRPLVTLLPEMLSLRHGLAESGDLRGSVFIGAAGGIGTPHAAAAAFAMGADYVTTGSINQGCVEAGTSEAVKAVLAGASNTDVCSAPAADMFAMGVQVQVLKKGTLFPMRAQKLYDLFRRHSSLEAIGEADRRQLEEQIFRMPLSEVRQRAVDYVSQKRPESLEALKKDPREMMLRTFLWYLAGSSGWATQGDPERKLDYQIWCGPAMGAFNAWTVGTPLAEPSNRRVAVVSEALMRGAAQLQRLQHLRSLGYEVPEGLLAVPPVEARQPSPSPPPDQEREKSVLAAGKDSSPPPSARKIAQVMAAAIAEQAGLASADIDVSRSFHDFALDSIKAMAVLNRLEAFLGFEISPTLVWNYPNIRELAEHLAGEVSGAPS